MACKRTACGQVICDHLGWGVKTGLPYIWHSKASNPFVNLRKEFKGIFWQEDIVPFFQAAQLSPAATTAEQCYLELAEQARSEEDPLGTFCSMCTLYRLLSAETVASRPAWSLTWVRACLSCAPQIAHLPAASSGCFLPCPRVPCGTPRSGPCATVAAPAPGTNMALRLNCKRRGILPPCAACFQQRVLRGAKGQDVGTQNALRCAVSLRHPARVVLLGASCAGVLQWQLDHVFVVWGRCL